MRGNLRRCTHGLRRQGSIPACAGEPRPLGQSEHARMVYPRVCGGTRKLCAASVKPHGLSPRVRGNRSALPRPRSIHRSIPACAGEPHTHYGRKLCAAVYPRVCGGTWVESMNADSDGGLSPRVRGNRFRPRPDIRVVRSIPACAGEPEGLPSSQPALGVYPRVCGGTARADGEVKRARGLSPRVRGNPLSTVVLGAWDGSIPACAGEPTATLSVNNSSTVYPRVCGGTPVRPVAHQALDGLSPRVRGNRIGL